MNTTQCPRPGLEPGPLNLESSALTMRPISQKPYPTIIVYKQDSKHFSEEQEEKKAKIK